MNFSKWRWPVITVIVISFTLGSLWGWQMVRQRALDDGLAPQAHIAVLAPKGFLSSQLISDFQKQEHILIKLHEESSPSAILRRAVKSSPGEYDAAIVFHYQVSALVNERKLQSLYDAQIKFPTSISPDFRILNEDLSLMMTAPLQWGVLGEAIKGDTAVSLAQLKFFFWPSFLISTEPSNLPEQNFITKYYSNITELRSHSAVFAQGIKTDDGDPLFISHAALQFSPLKERALHFRGLPSAVGTDSPDDVYPIWIATLVGLSDGDIGSVRKLMRFLLDPVQNIALLQTTKNGATTLRDQDAFNELPAELKSSYFRNFSLLSVLIGRDERLRQTDDLLEQALHGADINPVIKANLPLPATPQATPKKSRPKPAVVTQPSASPVAPSIAPSIVEDIPPAGGDNKKQSTEEGVKGPVTESSGE